jgi:hypothetical protein
VHVDIRPHAHGYMATNTLVRGHMKVEYTATVHTR